uniref:Ionotropic receptor 5 n=1 Tax=Propsilocerus akamusi TaxID=903466 RepID=A0A7D0TC99_9DIPT|nr:ionotropic receptor 5 [Propsilocerus akamusi]
MLRSDFSLKLLCASENLDRDFCERGVDLGLSDSVKRLCTGFVIIQIFIANNSSAFNASHGVSFSSTATFLTFHRNSSIATISAKRQPKPKTTNTPPTLSIPSSAASSEAAAPSSLHFPPFHHFSFNMLNFPSSCSFNTAPLIAVRYGEFRGKAIP